MWLGILGAVLFSFKPVVILQGPPGSGKGTCAQYLKEKHDYNHLSAGDLIRSEIEKKTEFGLQIADIVKRGDYVDQAIMYRLIRERVEMFVKEDKPFIIDGAVRSLDDLIFLRELLNNLNLTSQAFLLKLDANDESCSRRILHRLICSQCAKVYNTETAQPMNELKCDNCSTLLQIRLNDTAEIIKKRLGFYRDQIAAVNLSIAQFIPMISYETNRPVEECEEFYENLANKLVHLENNDLLWASLEWNEYTRSTPKMPKKTEFKASNFQ